MSGGDWAHDRLIPDIVRALIAGEEVIIRSPKAVRPWQHVLEPLSGYLLLAQRLFRDGRTYADAWNFGLDDNDAKPVEWIVRRVCELLPENQGFQIDEGEHPHEAGLLKLDSSKARQLLGWRPCWTLSEALRHTTEWSSAYIRHEDMKDVTLH